HSRSPSLLLHMLILYSLSFFFFNHPPPTAIYPLSLHDALPIWGAGCAFNDIVDRKFDAQVARTRGRPIPSGAISVPAAGARHLRSEEHTSELQSLTNLVCRLLL